MSLRCFIADDEPLARQRLARMLGACDGVEVVGEARDGRSALEQLAKVRCDLLLLDIEMPDLGGLEVAAALPAVDRPAVVFVTAYDEHALRAFELAAVDYLVKPVARARLEAALAKVRARPATRESPLPEAIVRLQAERPPHRMALRCGAKLVVFDPSRVAAIVSRDHYSALLVDGKELLADDPLDELCRRFDPAQMIRIHRAAAVNVLFLSELLHEGDRRYVAVLSDAAATRLPVSRERLPSLKAILGLKG